MEFTWTLFFQFLIIGLATGSLVALIALGYTLVYGIIELINFAHGEVFMMGALFASTLVVLTGVTSDSSSTLIIMVLAFTLIASMAFSGILNATIDRLSASIDAPPTGDVVRARARTCVNGGGSLDCDGNMDFMTLQEIDQAAGASDLFVEAASGTWHCVLLHVTLNTPGAADGSMSVEVDGNLEAELDELDFRADYEDGLNVIQFSGYRAPPPPMAVYRYIDDLVVSAVPVECG